MDSKELKNKYLNFFEKRGHSIINSSSLIPENDPTVLFTTAGMHPLVPYILGEKHPCGKRLVNFQKCIRTGDIDGIGDSSHLTFFEMLGNWSLGDYFKKEAIEWSFEFLTKELKIPIKKLAITCFAGDPKNNIPKDEESEKIWLSLGIKNERISFLGWEENWWGPPGMTGPCGPDTEMYYWTGKDEPPTFFNISDKRWMEIWNNVFMQYNKTSNGQYKELAQKNVDTGMGIERTIAILNGKDNVYETDLFVPIFKEIKKIASSFNQKSVRIIADHLRAATFILGDQKGITPSNIEQGYVLRRLIRRAIRHGKIIGINKAFCFKIAKTIINEFSYYYPELEENKEFIKEQLSNEEEKFSKTLEKGLREFKKMSEKNQIIDNKNVFLLFSTYGFPLEITKELAQEKGIKVDEKGFLDEFKKHQEISRTGAEKKFKGGLADNSKITSRMHTATHLMLASLRKVLGNHVFQKGANITSERIRFDFSHPEKLTEKQVKKIENMVNEQIQKNIPIDYKEVNIEEAKKIGAMGIFDHKYGKKVKIYRIGNFSVEICGGPHAKNTGELGIFKIIKEESSGSGVRRIKAILS